MRAGADPWRRRLSDCIDRVAGKEVRREIVLDDADPEVVRTQEENISWTRGCMERLRERLTVEEGRDVLTGCAHMIPDPRITRIREFYRGTEDIDALMEFWQEDFLRNLRIWVGPLPDEWSQAMLKGHWGEVGVRDGDRILATKIPADLKDYFEAGDDVTRRRAYCHCRRVRECIGEEELPAEYCYCGAGFYKANWERVLGRPVRVEVLSSVMRGDPVCSFAIHIEEE